jgi:hypothetical protein
MNCAQGSAQAVVRRLVSRHTCLEALGVDLVLEKFEESLKDSQLQK